jgi:uncharacterized protein
VDALTFRTEDGLTLEGELRVDGVARGSAVICHPHPLHGGSKDHPVLWALRIELARRGFAVLTFNFRGVMGSEGSHGGGIPEVNDARAAIGRVREESRGPTFVCGWSFGASVALREAVHDDRVGALGLLGFPLASSLPLEMPPLPEPAELGRFDRPVLFVSGDADPYSPAPELRALGGRFDDATVEIVAGTDHYFPKREREAAALVAAFAESNLFGRFDR